jgi:serpin B
VALGAAISVGSLGNTALAAGERVSPDLTAGVGLEDATLGEAMSRLGWRLVPSLAEPGAGDNVLLSPWGLATVMTVIDLGARGGDGHGRGAVTEAWTGRADATEVVMARIGAMRTELSADPTGDVSFHDAGGIWVAASLTVSDTLAEAAGERLDVKVENVDFTDPGTVPRLNAWAAEHTGGAIPTLLAQADPNLDAVVANAFRFSGPWAQPFKPAQTQPGPFLVEGAPIGTVDYMHGVFSDLTVVRSEVFDQISLPLSGGEAHLRLTLPKPDYGPEDLATAGAGEATPTPVVVGVTLPRFSIETDVDLTDALSTAGLGMLFDGTGDFSGLAEGLTRFDRVGQRVRLKVDESGVEAAAVTVAASTRSMGPQPEISLVFDRPFLVELVHGPTGAVLLCGLVRDPTP